MFGFSALPRWWMGWESYVGRSGRFPSPEKDDPPSLITLEAYGSHHLRALKKLWWPIKGLFLYIYKFIVWTIFTAFRKGSGTDKPPPPPFTSVRVKRYNFFRKITITNSHRALRKGTSPFPFITSPLLSGDVGDVYRWHCILADSHVASYKPNILLDHSPSTTAHLRK